MHWAGVLALLSWGCSVPTESNDPQRGTTTHAAIRVTQVETLEGTSRADAMAGFLKVPVDGDPDQLLALAGLHEILPPRGDCRSNVDEQAVSDFQQTSSAELLEAATVELVTMAGSHSLAPRAFPGIGDLLRGVIYTNRERDNAELPAGMRYSVEGRALILDSGERADVVMAHDSPRLPQGVQINGNPLSTRTLLTRAPVLDVSWTPQRMGDLVSVRVQGDRFSLSCTFSDNEGFGSIPLVSEGGAHPSDSEFLLSVHRIRQFHEAGPEGVDDLRMRFDFAVEGTIAFDPAGTL